MMCVGFLVHIAYIFARIKQNYKLKIIILQDFCHFNEFLTKSLLLSKNGFKSE